MDNFISEIAKSHAFFLIYLFFPGFLTALSLNLRFKNILSYVVCGFCLSLFLSQIFIFICVAFGLAISIACYLISFYCLIIGISRFQKIRINYNAASLKDLIIIAPVCLIFIFIMFINGGLLSENSDAWWHMAYAKKLSYSNSIFLERHHLSGLEITNIDSYLNYLPGWHVILASIHQSSGLPLLVLWHNLASFLVPLTVASYFIFSKALTNNTVIAFLAAILLCITLGGLNTYFRVSPWPGNIAYILWYFLYFLAFRTLNQFLNENGINSANFTQFLTSLYQEKTSLLVVALITCYLILSIHASELLWFAVSFIFYYLIARFFSPKCDSINGELNIIKTPAMILVTLATAFFIFDHWQQTNADLILCAILFIGLYLLGCIPGHLFNHDNNKPVQSSNYFVIATLVIVFILLINKQQISYLFYPASQSLNEWGHQIPYQVEGYFSSKLWLPQWEHQIREGLLLSGMAGVIMALLLAVKTKNRAVLFLFGNSFLALLTLCSPYLFTFLNQFTPHSSTYRVHLLIFHPIIIAYFIYYLSNKIRVKETS